ncbi:MAG: triose-phosphate isomerase [Alteromonadaceae bacterium]|nr:triose-phosphate isomerase [Alteromonadaceae bacterium]
MTRRAIVAANWKMNGDLDLVNKMTEGLKDLTLAENVDVILCPSSPYLMPLSEAAKAEHVHLGAQNVSEHQSGAYTGEISTNMLHEMSVEFVIIGHSERRSIYKETSIEVAQKVKAVLAANLTPILCIGESEAERTAQQTETVLSAQLQPVIDEIGIEKFAEVVIAYEPVWAIGTGKTASPEMAQETHQFIRKFLADVNTTVANKVPLLYGGSVNASNCENLFAQADIDGGLIGGASLKVEEFKVICSTAKGS